MGRIRFPRPHSATVISLVALFVALGGASYAAVATLAPKNSVNSASVINGSLQKVDLSKRAVAALKGNRGPQGPHGATGPQGSQGQSGQTGAPGTALAYAYVSEFGTLINSNNVAAVTHPSVGVWCFRLSFTAHVAVATVTGFAGNGNQIIHTSIGPAAGDACKGSNQTDAAAFMVLPDGSRTDSQFFIEFN